MLGVIITVLGFAITALHPQCTKLHYILDCISLVLLSLLQFSVMGFVLGSHNSIPALVSRVLGFLGFGLLLLYIIFLVCYWIIYKEKVSTKNCSFSHLETGTPEITLLVGIRHRVRLV